MTDWEKKGCKVCRKLWEKGQTPRKLSENIEYHAKLYKCDVCNSLWEEYERYADVVLEEDVKERYPKVFKLG